VTDNRRNKKLREKLFQLSDHRVTMMLCKIILHVNFTHKYQAKNFE